MPSAKLIVRTINILLMRPCLFNHLRARGIHVSQYREQFEKIKLEWFKTVCVLSQVYFWVLNKDDEFKEAFELGATGIMTDYPTRLKLFLKNKARE